MKIQLSMLTSDWLIWALFILVIIVAFALRRVMHVREAWRQVLANRIGMIAATILCFYAVVGLLDSIHFEVRYPEKAHSVMRVKSLFDFALGELTEFDEQTYSAPLATHAYVQSVVTNEQGKDVRDYARLQHGGVHLQDPSTRWLDIAWRVSLALGYGLLSFLIIATLFIFVWSRKNKRTFSRALKEILQGNTKVAWREVLITFGIIWLYIFTLANLMSHYHIFGTDKVGHDVFYASIKSIRTGLLIGILTTVFILPFALVLGMVAGFFGGWVDDFIQYLYTTLSSIPGVLLISATILVMQVYIASHPNLFPTLIQRADARLIALCVVLGLTSWASLCRLLRAETLKLRELEFVQAARSLGVGKFKILFWHIMPNIMHIVIITVVLDFSMLVLAEAVLSYVGVGVDPTTYSWGNMINSSRLELARDPMVWWPLLSAMFFMFMLVLAANLFSDAVRDALDPRIHNLAE